MGVINFEFKAKTNSLLELEEKLLLLNPIFIGEDHQADTYFNTVNGRLKLREGNIENALIYYERENNTAAKLSNIILYQHKPNTALKEILTKTHGIKVIVEKVRRIYFIENVKFHFDTVRPLGTFVEVEAIDTDGNIGIEKLKEQCNYYAQYFSILENNFIDVSYSDMVINLK